MTFTWEKQIDTFRARSADGRTFQITIYQEVQGDTDTVRRIETLEGHTVRQIDDTTFKIVEHDLIVKKLDRRGNCVTSC